MMMSSHRSTIEYLNEKIDELNKDYGVALNMRNAARDNLERKEKDVKQIEYELEQLTATKRVLEHDAATEVPC